MIAVVGIIAGVLLARMVEETTRRATTSAILGDIARMDATTPMGTAGGGRPAASEGVLPDGVTEDGGKDAPASPDPPDDDGADGGGPGRDGGAPSSNGRVD